MARDNRGANPGRGVPARESGARDPRRIGGKPTPGEGWLAFLVCGLLALATGLVYGQLGHHQFLNFDDNAYIYDNPHVRTGLRLENVVWALTAFHSNNWHPLTWLSHMLDCQLFGLDAGMHHLVSVLLHGANGIVLFLVLWRMTGALWPGAIVAAVFLLHPLRVESVAWASERKDVLSAFFGLLTIGAYAAYAKRPGVWRYAAVVLSFALGLLAKPMLVSLPFVLLLLDVWPLRRFESDGRAGEARKRSALLPWLDKLPLVALAAASSFLTLAAQRQSGIVQSLEAISLPMRLANASVSFVRYAIQMLVPLRQAFYYAYPRTLPVLEAAASLAALAAVTFACVRMRRERPYALVGWLWYVGMLVPVIGLVQVATQAMADRYTYLPSIGFFLAITWGVADVIRDRPAWRVPVAVVAVVSLVGLAAQSWAQAAYWKDSITLFTHDAQVVPDNVLAYRNLGVALGDAGRYPEALAMFQKTLPFYPHDATTLYDIGHVLYKLGRDPEAVDAYRESIRYWPAHAEAHLGLGRVLMRLQRGEEAIAEFREAIRLRPDLAGAYNSLGNALWMSGQHVEAVESFRQALRLDPAFAEAHNNLGTAFRNTGRDSAALEEYQAALRLNPNLAIAELNSGIVYLSRGDTTEARRHFARAVQLDPELRDDLARELGEGGRAASAPVRVGGR